MTRVLQILTFVFSLLTIAGAIYVLLSDGTKNAGYAVIPMVLSLVFSNAYKICKRKEK